MVDKSVYECKHCEYITTRFSQYNRHLLTTKHKNIISLAPTNENIINKKYICNNCNKSYKHHSSLWNHKKTCVESNTCDEKELFYEILKINNNLQEKISELSKHIITTNSKIQT